METKKVVIFAACFALGMGSILWLDKKATEPTADPITQHIDLVSDFIQKTNRYERVWFDGMEREVRLTAYNPVPGQTFGNHWENARGTKVRSHGIALSRDLLTDYDGGPFSMGDTVFVVVPFIVEDTMAKRNKQRADILLERRHAARIWGVRDAWLLE